MGAQQDLVRTLSFWEQLVTRGLFFQIYKSTQSPGLTTVSWTVIWRGL